MSKVIENYTVRISGIKSRPELNGELGNLTGEPTGVGRYTVKLNDGSIVSLKWSSLLLVNPKKYEMVERRENPLPYGAGLYAKKDIAKGSLIFKADEPPLHLRKENDLRQLWRFSTNHSCSQNIVSTPKYSDHSDFVFALRDIKAGEELVRSYCGACTWTPKKDRSSVLRKGHTYGQTNRFQPGFDFDCMCLACSREEGTEEEDQLRVETKGLAGIVFTMTAEPKINREMWYGAIRPYLSLKDTNPVKVVIGFCTYRGLYPALFDHMKRADFVGRSDVDFRELFATVKNMCIYLHVMFGFPNNALVTDSSAGQPIHVNNVDQVIGQYM